MAPASGARAGAAPSASPARGIALMALGVALVTVLDACIKALTARMPVPEAMFFRCALALPLLLAALPRDGGLAALRRTSLRIQAVRGLLAFATGYAFFTALSRMPLADGLVIGFASPFLVAALSGPLLGEPVPRRQWLAILAGFAGVVVVLGPDGRLLEPAALWAISAAVTYALANLLLRRLGRTDAATATAIWSTAIPGALYGLLAIPGWVAPAAADWPLLAAAGALGAVGSVLVGAAFRHAPAATLAPIEYTALVWAVALGFAVFGDVPGPWVVAGSALIVASGLALSRPARPR